MKTTDISARDISARDIRASDRRITARRGCPPGCACVPQCCPGTPPAARYQEASPADRRTRPVVVVVYCIFPAPVRQSQHWEGLNQAHQPLPRNHFPHFLRGIDQMKLAEPTVGTTSPVRDAKPDLQMDVAWMTVSCSGLGEYDRPSKTGGIGGGISVGSGNVLGRALIGCWAGGRIPLTDGVYRRS